MLPSPTNTAPSIGNENIYEVNIRQYTPEGTFKAFAAHLPRLQHMGVKIIWLMPIYPIGIKNRKGSLGSYYSISNFTATNPEFGAENDFENLVLQIHSLGMKIIIDWVANHAAWDNVWTKNHADYFMQDDKGHFKNAFDWEDVIQINHNNSAQQNAMIAAMEYWVARFNIDGFRADLAHLTPLAFWVKAKAQISNLKPDLIWLAETEEIAYHQVFHISYTWKWMHEMELFCQGKKTLSDAVKVLEWYKNDFPENALRMFFTSNHDENSWNGTEYEKYGSFAQNMAVLSCSMIGIPLLYTGQELPNTNRLPFFDKATIAWRPINELHTFYKTLFNFRLQNKIYQTATLKNVTFNETLIKKNILAFSIFKDDDEILVFLNFTNYPFSAEIALNTTFKNYKNAFTNETIIITNFYLLQLESAEFLILEKNRND